MTFRKKIMMPTVIFLGVMATFPLYCNQSESKSNGKTDSDGLKKQTFQFNVNDKNALSNGNIQTAVAMYDWISANSKTPDSAIYPDSITRLPIITKQPYSAIGKLFRVRGKIYKIEQMQPGTTGSAMVWTDILLSAPDKNNALGSSSIEFLYNGNVSDIDNKDIIDLFGYFCGTFESANAMGGTVQCLSFVGNHAKMFRKYRKEYY
jgi:hypothetical protein